MPSGSPPPTLAKAVAAGVLLVILIVGVVVIIILGGATDPPLAGPARWQDATLTWAGGARLDLAPGDSSWWEAPPDAAIPARAFTLDVSARLEAASDPAAAWGIWLLEADGSRLLYAISGEGYTTTRRCAPAVEAFAIEECPAVRPEWLWMPYNRLYAPGATNTITLHVEDSGELRLRLNDETLGASPLTWAGAWGLWTRGGRADGALLEWEGATLYAAEGSD